MQPRWVINGGDPCWIAMIKSSANNCGSSEVGSSTRLETASSLHSTVRLEPSVAAKRSSMPPELTVSSYAWVSTPVSAK